MVIFYLKSHFSWGELPDESDPQLISNEMAVRLLFDKTKVVGVETIASPKPKKGAEKNGIVGDFTGNIWKTYRKPMIFHGM